MLMVPSSNPRDKDSNGENPEKRSLYGITQDNYAITLINPFPRVSPSTLPPIMQVESYPDDETDWGYEYDIDEIVLSADPYLSPHSYQAPLYMITFIW
ncbi:hypothetical protein RHMOL_Rhmol03G0216600 [Rhododendron molle]|uniref:Uncharacterized protein n=1 Tax=Rhododendron molle TaxID=49168 RepID=A0ACC0PGQ8_RHOML|nr:hypothetical protein RHMOL_Rhmol03G0216600 [Rhododendron molle]